jgi:heat shock protein HslJ
MMAVAASLAACGSGDGAATGGSSDAPLITLAPGASAGDPSGAWVLVSGPTDPISGFDVTVEIDNDRIFGTAACNGYGGTVEIGEGTIVVSELGFNQEGCESDVQQLERDFLTSLGEASAFLVSGEQLQITTPQGAWQFDRLMPLPTAEIVGTKWVVDGYIDGDDVSKEVGMGDAFIELSEDGSVAGATNCRALSGMWIATGSEIVFPTFRADGDCPNDAARDLDSRIIGVLGDGFSAEINADQLTLTSRGNQGLTFRPDNG